MLISKKRKNISRNMVADLVYILISTFFWI